MAIHKRTLNQAVEVVEELKKYRVISIHRQTYLYRLIEDIKFPHLLAVPYYNQEGSPRSRGCNAYVAHNFETIINLLTRGSILKKRDAYHKGKKVIAYDVNQVAVSQFLKVFGPKYKNY